MPKSVSNRRCFLPKAEQELILPISKGKLKQGCLSGKVAVVTGSGRGIGYEAARSLAWLGAKVVIAEIDAVSGKSAAERICAEMGQGAARFVETDVADDESVRRLAGDVMKTNGRIDAVLNNACAFILAAVKDTNIADWDSGYQVNLRGPLLLTLAFLPVMLKAKSGVLVNVSSSGAAPFMGPYEIYKTAQVELANTLAAELEGTGVVAFTIGPGLVRTPGSLEGISKLAPLYGKTVDEFYQMSSEAMIPVEEAGAGFAAAIAMAKQYDGHEISSMSALVDAGIPIRGREESTTRPASSPVDPHLLAESTREVRDALVKQNADWKRYSIFFRQWMVRDFKKNAGMPMDAWLVKLKELESAVEKQGNIQPLIEARARLQQLDAFYDHLIDSQRGYQKDLAKRDEGERAIRGWQEPVRRLLSLIQSN
jgi:NAD(P)-dependent dehydrogenase (short-subunit alcohol dehydrogenase family)